MVVLSAVTPDAKQTNGDSETDWSARTWMAFTKQRLSVALHYSTSTRPRRRCCGQASPVMNRCQLMSLSCDMLIFSTQGLELA